MYKAIGSKKELNGKSGHRISHLYYEVVKDIIDSPEITELDNYSQHLSTSRLQHSINVSYYSFRLARLLRLNERAAARAGLLHDMYYYNYNNSQLTCTEHSKLHSELALENAKKITAVDSLEEDIILTHMWPMTKKAPSYFEGYVVTITDKSCALAEVISKLPKLPQRLKYEKPGTISEVITKVFAN